MSAKQIWDKHGFLISFTTLFVGMHYGWHVLQTWPEVNHGNPPKELPATLFVKLAAKKIGDWMGSGEGAASELPTKQ